MRQNFYTENNNQEGYILRYTTSFHFFLLGTLFSGCASITGSEMQSVSVQTRTKGGLPVKEASCKLTNDRGIWMVTTPASIMVRKSAADMSISCEKETFEPGMGRAVSKANGGMFGNIIFGGGIGAIIDHSKGTAYDYPNFFDIEMGANQVLGGSADASQQTESMTN